MSTEEQGNKLEGNYTSEDYFFPQELELAFRNRGIPAEGLRFPVTPTGMHYLLNHFDIPEIDSSGWNLKINGHVKNPISIDLIQTGKPIPAGMQLCQFLKRQVANHFFTILYRFRQ